MKTNNWSVGQVAYNIHANKAYSIQDPDECIVAFATSEERAKLIAAAPELLDIAVMLAALDSVAHEVDTRVAMQDVIAKARAAIVKATGEQL